MKKLLFSFALLLWVAGLLPAQPGSEYIVTNVPELLDAIGPQRTITLQPGNYDLSAHSGQQGEYYSFTGAYDGVELEISGVSNLLIRGAGDREAHLIARPRYGNVIRFRGCQDITVQNIKAGHGPEKGYCTGGVLLFEGCQGIRVDDCHLYGSGTEGLTLMRSQGIAVTQTLIQGCTYSIVSMAQCQGATFDRCAFFDNEQFDLVNISQCGPVVFRKCTFGRNQNSSNSLFFSVNQSEFPMVKKCTFRKNQTGFLAQKEGMLVLKGNRYEDNSWDENSMYRE
ncbi:MAG: right-handed parallel beta-helix repeat-containing protein [Bacteroidota bacterium]